jgi:hypothetical protein
MKLGLCATERGYYYRSLIRWARGASRVVSGTGYARVLGVTRCENMFGKPDCHIKDGPGPAEGGLPPSFGV